MSTAAASPERGEVGDAGEPRRQGDAGQPRRLARLLGLGHRRGVAAPEPHRPALGRLRHRERGAEGAGADHRDHALAPLRPAPSIGAAASSSGQRGRAASARPSGSATAMRSAAAQAIIAPLSVQSASGGATKRAPCSGRDGFEAGADRARSPRPRRRRRAPARGDAEGAERPAGLLGERLRHRRLEAGAEVGAVGAGQPALRRDQPVARPAHRGLEPGERQVAAFAVEKRARKAEAAGVARARLGFDGRTARLRQPEELRDLVEGLARRVVDGAAEAAEAHGTVDGEELAVAARDQQHQVGKADVLDEPRGQRVPGEVVDAPERQPAGGGEALGEHHAGQHPADQPGAGGDGDGVEVGEPDAGPAERGGGDEVQPLGVGAGGDLGHDPAIGVVQRVLADDLGGEDLGARPAGAGADHRGGGVVAAALDAEDHPHLASLVAPAARGR